MSNYGPSYRESGGGMSQLPQMIKFLLISNLLVFVFQYFLLDGFVIGEYPINNLIMKFFALQPLTSLTNPLDSSFFPWQLISYQFMHSGIFHIFFNMLALWMFGQELEYYWGSKKFIIYYLLCGIGAGIVQLFVADAPTIGASGSVFGLLLAFGFTFPNRLIMMFPIFIPIPAKFAVIIFGVFELISGFSNTNSNVAHFAHLGGALTGYLLLRFASNLSIFKNRSGSTLDIGKSKGYSNVYSEPEIIKPNWQKPNVSSTTTAMKKFIMVEGEEVTQSKIDALLDKINTTGYQSLTDKEKKLLKDLSKKI